MPRQKILSDDQILERALPVMARAGPSGFTLTQLSDETGLSPATLLQRFGTKRALIERAFARDNERFAQWIANLPEGRGPKKRGIGATLAVYRAATTSFHNEPHTELADHLLWLREDIRDPVFNAMARARFALFRAAILKRLPPTRLPPKEVASLLDAQCHGAIMQWAIEPRGSLAAHVMKSLTAIMKLAVK
jgi:TetR/AcrR family transcriptional regulator, macrolide resistance operon repressor